MALTPSLCCSKTSGPGEAVPPCSLAMAEESHGLGLFVRSLIGLDRNAAKDALAEFLDGKSLTGNQIEFVNLVVNHLTEHGIVDAARLYESPFTDVAAHGPDGIFDQTQVETLVTLLSRVKATAIAA